MTERARPYGPETAWIVLSALALFGRANNRCLVSVETCPVATVEWTLKSAYGKKRYVRSGGGESHGSEAVVAVRVHVLLRAGSARLRRDHVRVHLDVLLDVDSDLCRLHPVGDLERLVESVASL